MTPQNPTGTQTTDMMAGTPIEFGDHPTRIGQYTILGLLGQGGMGVVYLAEQKEPVRREVAIKVINSAAGSDVVLARFNTERQALAVMEHPSITKVFEAGVTSNGWPYFVMERVSGTQLTEYSDAHRLSIPDRLRLFGQICRAVQHAHQKGIVHRDLKPSNVLVTESDGAPLAKVIDFGIAKATQDTQSHLTLTGMAVGTPAYMSPEQALGSGLDVDTRSDIYSLGVILYELVSGVLPFDFEKHGPRATMTHHITVDPPAPSARVAALDPAEQTRVAGKRRTDAPDLRRALKGDIDWITLKALDKERDRRYQTPSEFAEDLDRHLANLPVAAGPPSGAYRIRKFVRRHRVGVAFAASIALLLVGSSVVLAIQARRIARARAIAEQRQGQAEDLISFMVGDLNKRLASVGRFDVLTEVMQKSQDYFAKVPESELSEGELFRRSQALRMLGDVRVDQGDFPAAMLAYRQSLLLADRLARLDVANGEWQLGLGASHFGVGFIHWRQSELDSALAHFTSYQRITQALVARAPDSLRYRLELGMTARNIGAVKEAKGDLAGALAAYRGGIAAMDVATRGDPANSDWQLTLANSYNAAGLVQRKMGDLVGAERTHRQELVLKRALVARDPSNRQYQNHLALALSFVGELLVDRGEIAPGLAELNQSRDLYASLAAADTSNPDRRRLLAITDRLVGTATFQRGDVPGAIREFSASLALLEPLAKSAPTNRILQRELARTLVFRGGALAESGRRVEGEAAVRRGLSLVVPALAQRPTDQSLRSAVTEGHLYLGDILARSSAAAGRSEWTAALVTIDSMARATQLTDLLALASAALLRLNRLDEARPMAQELIRRGYARPRWLAIAREKKALPGP